MDHKLHGDDDHLFMDLSWGKRAERLRHAIRLDRIKHGTCIVGVSDKLSSSDRTMYAIERLAGGRMRHTTLALFAEGLERDPAELVAFINSDEPYEPVCPVQLMLLEFSVPMSDMFARDLSTRLSEYIRINELTVKETTKRLDIPDYLLRNLLRCRQERIATKSLHKLAKFFDTDAASLIKKHMT